MLANEPHESHVVQPSYPSCSDPKPTEELHAQSSNSEEFHESRTAHSEELHASHSAWSSNPKSTEEVHEHVYIRSYTLLLLIGIAISFLRAGYIFPVGANFLEWHTS